MAELHKAKTSFDILMRRGINNYIHYLGAVATLNNPQSTIDLHKIEVHPDHASELRDFVTTRAIVGATGVIKATIANYRISTLYEHRDRLGDWQGRMQSMVDRSYRDHADQIGQLGSVLSVVRPAMFLEPDVFEQLCTNEGQDLTLAQIADGAGIDPFFISDLPDLRQE